MTGQRKNTHQRLRPKRILLYAVAVVGYYLLFQAFYNMVAYKTIWPYTGLKHVLYGVLYNFTPILLLFVTNIGVVFRMPKQRTVQTKIVIDALTSFAILVALNMLFMFIVPGATIDWAGTVFTNVFLLLGIEVAYYVQHYRESVQRETEAKQMAIQLQYDVLKSQVSPHFLFNSLNMLYSLTMIDIGQSREFIMSLSDMYRYIMSQQNQERIQLSEELEFLDSYVRVLKMRYNQQFHVDIHGQEHAAGHEIIPYTMQLLIENVTKHNAISSALAMHVDVVIAPDGITVSNPIRPKHSPSVSRVGLRYITELYQRHGRTFSYENDGHTFVARVPYL